MIMTEPSTGNEIGEGDSKGKGDQDWISVSPSKKIKLYRLDKQKTILNGYVSFLPCESIIDYHTLVITEIGNARKKDIQLFLETCFERYSLENKDYVWGSWKINLVIDRHGVHRGIAYVYFRNSEMFHLLLGNKKNGERNVLALQNSHYGETYDINSYKNFSFKQDEYIYVPQNKHCFDFPVLKTEGQLKIPHIVPYHINVVAKTNVLVSSKIPPWVNEGILRKEIEIFEDKNIFITTTYHNQKGLTFYITFPSNTMATFSLVMMKKIKIKKDNLSTIIYFKLLKKH